MSGAIGWGIGPKGAGPKGVRADQPPPSQSDDIHAIRRRFCGPKTLNTQTFSFAANSGTKYDLTGTAVNGILLTAVTGQVNGYFGDNTTQFGKPALLPHFVGSASVSPNTVFIPVPPAEDYIFSLQEGVGGTATGTITFIYE